jgi:hypothetical protein
MLRVAMKTAVDGPRKAAIPTDRIMVHKDAHPGEPQDPTGG